MSATGTPTITVVGAGLAGAVCARTLADAGVDVRVLDRGRAPGGRMASPLLHGRRVDLGAGYFTVRDDGFAAQVAGWQDAGLVREWTDTFGVLSPGAQPTTSTGPMRWGTPAGLRSLVRDVLGDLEVSTVDLDALPAGDVVVAMPDPQASRLHEVPGPVEYEPVIAVALGFGHDVLAGLPFADAAFVNDHPQISFLAHDGARRGDGAPVLVVHTTSDLARSCLADPTAAIAPVTAAVSELCGLPEPVWSHAHRWTFAKPTGAHETTHTVVESDGRRIGFAGDQWCPQGSPRVESAWRSGVDLAHALL